MNTFVLWNMESDKYIDQNILSSDIVENIPLIWVDDITEALRITTGVLNVLSMLNVGVNTSHEYIQDFFAFNSVSYRRVCELHYSIHACCGYHTLRFVEVNFNKIDFTTMFTMDQWVVDL